MWTTYTSDPYNLPDVLQAIISIFAVAAEFYPPLVGQAPTCDAFVAGGDGGVGDPCRAIWTQIGIVWTIALLFVRLMQELRG